MGGDRGQQPHGMSTGTKLKHTQSIWGDLEVILGGQGHTRDKAGMETEWPLDMLSRGCWPLPVLYSTWQASICVLEREIWVLKQRAGTSMSSQAGRSMGHLLLGCEHGLLSAWHGPNPYPASAPSSGGRENWMCISRECWGHISSQQPRRPARSQPGLSLLGQSSQSVVGWGPGNWPAPPSAGSRGDQPRDVHVLKTSRRKRSQWQTLQEGAPQTSQKRCTLSVYINSPSLSGWRSHPHIMYTAGCLFFSFFHLTSFSYLLQIPWPSVPPG